MAHYMQHHFKYCSEHTDTLNVKLDQDVFAGGWSKRPIAKVSGSKRPMRKSKRPRRKSKRPMRLVNASGTNDVVIRLSDLINYMN